MKSKVLAALVATMAVGATCAFAANPFVDVPTDSWAYKSVVELADSGIIQGVDGTHFEGGRNITRYEAAEIVAKAMAHMDKASVEQRALINKLADEYADELNSLGVRVSALENKVGNVKLSGDARIRFQNQDKGVRNPEGVKNDNSFDYQVNLVAEAQVNDRTKVTYGLTTDDVSFGDNTAASDSSVNPYTSLANVEYQAGSHVTLLAGRYDYQIGNGLGLQYSDTFDGAQATFTSGNVSLTGGYGKFKKDSDFEDNNMQNLKAGYASLDGTFGNVGAGVYYTQFNHSGSSEVGPDSPTTLAAANLDNIFGGYLSLNFGEKWNLLGDYQKVSKDKETSTDQDADLWGAKLTYGAADQEVKGSWDAWVEYIESDPNALYGSTGSWRSGDLIDNVKSWGVGVDYTLGKNVVLTVAQSFGSEAKDGSNDPEELTDVELNFFF